MFADAEERVLPQELHQSVSWHCRLDLFFRWQSHGPCDVLPPHSQCLGRDRHGGGQHVLEDSCAGSVGTGAHGRKWRIRNKGKQTNKIIQCVPWVLHHHDWQRVADDPS